MMARVIFLLRREICATAPCTERRILPVLGRDRKCSKVNQDPAAVGLSAGTRTEHTHEINGSIFSLFSYIPWFLLSVSPEMFPKVINVE